MESVIQTMMNCISDEVCGRTEKIVLPEDSAQFLTELYKLSKAHDIAHLVGDALNKSGIFEKLPADIDENERAAISKVKEKFDEQIFTAVYRFENMNAELEDIRDVFRDNDIAFIFLKGAVIRKYYPEQWMRTSSDIDILIKSEQLKSAINVLIDRLSYEQKGEWIDEISLYSPSGVHIELHCTLVEDCVVKTVDSVLTDIWTQAERIDETNEYALKDEAYYYYHIAHMAKHFLHGGCGVRPFIDLWILDHKVEHSADKRIALLARGGLSKFAKAAQSLSDVWFNGGEHIEVTLRLEQYILRGGVYGTQEQYIAVSHSRSGGTIGYIMKRAFVSFDELSACYPSLKKCPILFPFYQVRRWCRILFCGGRKAALNEIKVNKNITKEQQEQAKKLLEDLNL